MQLLHVKSNRFLTANKKLPAQQEKNAQRVYFDYVGSEASWFLVQPFYKLRALGDRVVVGDKIVLQSFTATLPLHVSEIELNDVGYEVNEVNLLAAKTTSWRVLLFMCHTEDRDDVIKTVSIV